MYYNTPLYRILPPSNRAICAAESYTLSRLKNIPRGARGKHSEEQHQERRRQYLKRRDTPGTIENERYRMWKESHKDPIIDETVNIGKYRPHLGIVPGEVLLQGKSFMSPQLRKKERE